MDANPVKPTVIVHHFDEHPALACATSGQRIAFINLYPGNRVVRIPEMMGCILANGSAGDVTMICLTATITTGM